MANTPILAKHFSEITISHFTCKHSSVYISNSNVNIKGDTFHESNTLNRLRYSTRLNALLESSSTVYSLLLLKRSDF